MSLIQEVQDYWNTIPKAGVNNTNTLHVIPEPIWIRPSKVKALDKKEHKMAHMNSTATVTVASPVDEAKSYLISRIHDLFWEKNTNLNKLYSDPKPESAEQARDWLKSGNWRFDEVTKDEEDYDSYYWREFFHWGKKEPDLKKRQKEVEALFAARTKATDIVQVVTDEQARLAALHEFEEYKVQ